jgi:hypothetical protein
MLFEMFKLSIMYNKISMLKVAKQEVKSILGRISLFVPDNGGRFAFK